MKKTQILSLLTGFLALVALSACTHDNTQDMLEIPVTQSDLDKAINHIKDATGGTFAHGGPDGLTGDSTIRMVYASAVDISSLPVGTIITKRTYQVDKDGHKADKLYATFALIKQGAGYNPSGGDLEYVMMPNDGTTDYTTHPNGTLPDAGDTRGKLSSCMGCHSAAGGGDFVFSN